METLPKRRGLALVICGPSGAGKSTACQQLLAGDDNLRFSTSCTTRAPRPGEVDGRDYHFIDVIEFERRVAAGAFLEHARVHDNFYGTPRAELETHLPAGRDLLLDIDVQGAAQLRAQVGDWRRDVCFVFFAPPSMAVLEQRLRDRGTETEERIRRRLAVARDETAQWPEFDYLVVNDQLADAVRALREILATERRRCRRLPPGTVDLG